MTSQGISHAADAATVSPSDAGSPAGHTAGPWSVNEAWGAEPGDPLRLCFHEIRAPNESVVASTWAGPNEADARLIAAAPDLLAVVEALIAWDNVAPPETDEEIDAFDWEAKDLTALIEAALAVRAKVTGQAAERWS